MQIGDKVRWLGAKEGGWTGTGKAEVAGYDPSRAFFGKGDPGANVPGPAVKLRLLDATWPGTEVWVKPDDLMPDLDAALEAATPQA